MSGLAVFSFEGSNIRTIKIDNEPWFVGKDICQLFGDKNHNRSLGRVDEVDKRYEEITDSMGREQQAIFINESGLYSLLFAMQPQKAHHKNGPSYEYPIEIQERIDKLHRFKRWVTNDVLPSIRKHGMYATEDTIDKILSNPDFGIRLLTELKAEREQRKVLEQTVAIQQTQIAEMQPKVNYHDIVLNCLDLVKITTIAKDFGKTAQWMNKYLHKKGIQFKQGDIWLPYKKYASEGFTSTKTYTYTDKSGTEHARISTYWTQKGRLFIYDTLKADGILPIIEQQKQSN